MVAAGSRMSPDVPDRVRALAESLYPDRTPEIFFHPQCLAAHGHFAGDDATRAQAFLDIANDESYDALWFGRGGYGSCRVVEAVMDGLTASAQRKAYLGYSDAGVLLAALYRAGFEAVAHGPVAQDILRGGGRGRGRPGARLDRRSRTGSVGADGRWCAQDCGIQHHGAEPVARHTAAARPRWSCPDAGGGGGGDVPDRQVAVSHHQQPRNQARSRDHAWPLQPSPPTNRSSE